MLVIFVLDSLMGENLRVLRENLKHKIRSIATTEQGASLLIKNQALEMWTQFMDIVLDRIESYQAKDYAMRTLTHLLRLVRAAFEF